MRSLALALRALPIWGSKKYEMAIPAPAAAIAHRVLLVRALMIGPPSASRADLREHPTGSPQDNRANSGHQVPTAPALGRGRSNRPTTSTMPVRNNAGISSQMGRSSHQVAVLSP